MTRETLNNVLLGQGTIDEKIKSGDIKVEGDQAQLDDLISMLDSFDFWFNIVTPNKPE